jgi:hypothetical protein
MMILNRPACCRPLECARRLASGIFNQLASETPLALSADDWNRTSRHAQPELNRIGRGDGQANLSKLEQSILAVEKPCKPPGLSRLPRLFLQC